MPTLETALALRPDGPGRWLAYADPDHESINAMFGGWTAAIALAGVVAAADGSRTPSALTVNYLAAIVPGTDVRLVVEHVGGSRSIDHWRTDLRAADDDHLMATATAVLTNRRPSEPHMQWTMPAAPDPDEFEDFHAPSTQGQQTVLRTVTGEWGSGDSRSSHWLRVVSGRPVDHLQLAYLADQYAPRSFYWGSGVRPSATITMSVYFHATPEELAEVGSDFILNEATGTRGEQGTSGQQARLWSRQGALLATTEQLAWYR